MKHLSKNIFSMPLYARLGLAILSMLSAHTSAAIINLNTTDTNMLGQNVELVIDISDLTNDGLSAFDIDLSFDDSLLAFTGYTLGTDLVDDFWGQDDYSLGQTSSGIINISELSWLIDFSAQPSDFILATLNFTSMNTGIANFSVAYYDLVDGNNQNILDINTETANVSISTNTVAEPENITLFLSVALAISLIRRKA